MKKASVSLTAFIIAIGLSITIFPTDSNAQASADAQTTASDQTMKPLPLPLPHLMAAAIDVHTTLTLLPGLKKESNQLTARTNEYKEAQERLKRLDECNINRLSAQFKDPARVWKKITDTYDIREKELAIYINSSEPVKTSGITAPDGTTYSDQELSEMLLHWSLGNEILTDVYANQDKWGERKAPKSPSFPLWKDQKYFFDKDWDAYYTKLNTFFGVPPQGRPLIDDRKYDYNRADETQMAHDLYLKTLMAKNPKRALLMPDDLKAGPQIAPRPLPPVEETVLYIGNIEQTHQIFPAWPEPWRKQIDNNFANFNIKGEMAKDFVPRTFQLKNDFAGYDPDKQNNRLNVYQLEKKKVDGAKKIMDATAVSVKSMKNSIQNNLQKLNISAPVDADMSIPQEYEKLSNVIKNHKYDLIKQIENRLTDRADHMQIKAVIEALKKDTDGKVYITPTNAVMIDQGLLEAAATEALQKEREDFAKAKQQSVQKEFNNKCLLGN